MPTTVRSYCKINLGLAIGPSRADGFHALTTLYQTLEAHDHITVEASPAPETAITLTTTNQRVPTDHRNTTWKIADLALKSFQINAKVHIHIEKCLPIQGGLGAGSANAIATLIGIEKELQRHGIPPLAGPEKLRIAAEVGSDVPLFLIGGSILGVGRGEEVYPMPDLPVTHCVLALPDIGVSTPQAFRDWDAQDAPLTRQHPSDTLKKLSRALASALCEPHSSGVFTLDEDLAKNPLLALVRTGIENDFEKVVFLQNPFLGEIKRTLAVSGQPEHAALYTALSGSGSALFGLYGTEQAAEAAENRLKALSIRSLRTQTLPRGEYWRNMVVDSTD